LNDEERIERESQTSPNQISLWAKNSIHESIIAVAAADGRGN
jgi:hypothetical protein